MHFAHRAALAQSVEHFTRNEKVASSILAGGSSENPVFRPGFLHTWVMSLTVNLYYTGAPGAAEAFAQDMINSGVVAAIRATPGNLRYEYFRPFDRPDTVLLIDQWADQAALDAHHASENMQKIAELRDKYDLHMIVERFEQLPEANSEFLRR